VPVQEPIPQGVGEIRPSVPEDCVYISQHLRAADLMELRAVGDKDAFHVIRESYERSELPFTGVWNGKPCCIFGIVRLNHRFFGSDGVLRTRGLGAPWMLGTDGVVEARWTFLKESKQMLDQLSQGYDFLWNRVHSKNTVHIRWLKWLGFEFGPPIVFSSGEVFHDFSKVIHVHH
jgi:hypothetical protein